MDDNENALVFGVSLNNRFSKFMFVDSDDDSPKPSINATKVAQLEGVFKTVVVNDKSKKKGRIPTETQRAKRRESDVNRRRSNGDNSREGKEYRSGEYQRNDYPRRNYGRFENGGDHSFRDYPRWNAPRNENIRWGKPDYDNRRSLQASEEESKFITLEEYRARQAKEKETKPQVQIVPRKLDQGEAKAEWRNMVLKKKESDEEIVESGVASKQKAKDKGKVQKSEKFTKVPDDVLKFRLPESYAVSARYGFKDRRPPYMDYDGLDKPTFLQSQEALKKELVQNDVNFPVLKASVQCEKNNILNSSSTGHRRTSTYSAIASAQHDTKKESS